jgi:hypothetical protein
MQASISASLSEATRILFIAGAPRCGTTAMSRYLGAHPNVCRSQPKETHFFLSPDSAIDANGSRKAYRRNHFSTLAPEQEMLLDGSISYLYSPEAAKRALSVFPESRFLVLLRNPVDLIHSYHSRLLFYSQESEPDLKRAWQLQEQRRNGHKIPWTCSNPKMLEYLEVGSLGRHLAAFLEAVGRDRCLCLLYDDFIGDPLRIYQQVLAFVGLPYDGRTAFPRKGFHRTFRSGWLQLIYSGAFLAPLLPVGSNSTAIYGRLARLMKPLRKRLRKLNSGDRPRVQLDDETRAMLALAFADDIAVLRNLTGFNLESWRAGAD